VVVAEKLAVETHHLSFVFFEEVVVVADFAVAVAAAVVVVVAAAAAAAAVVVVVQIAVAGFAVAKKETPDGADIKPCFFSFLLQENLLDYCYFLHLGFPQKQAVFENLVDCYYSYSAAAVAVAVVAVVVAVVVVVVVAAAAVVAVAVVVYVVEFERPAAVSETTT
jgi:hypothetical protein